MKKGFTLVELLMIIAIIGILSSVIVVGMGGSRAKSRDAVRVGDLKSLSYAAERYFSEYFEFPADIAYLDQYFTSSAPKDPKTKSPYSYINYDIGGAHKYCLGAIMETSIPSPATADQGCTAQGNYIIKGP